nr:alpha/beta fold hydrolase [Dethiobacter alkaliphilus]
MYKLTFILLILLAVVTASCSTQTAPADPPLEGDVTDLAVDFVTKLSEEDFAGTVAYYDANMRQALPESNLREVWEQLLGQAGPFVGILDTRVESDDEYDAVLVTSEFESLVLDIRVVFNRDKRVAGLFFQPAQEHYESEYRLPPYTDTAAFTEYEVTVGSGEWALPGTLTVPLESGSHPAVVLVHGSGPNDRDETIGPNKPFKDLATGLSSRGIAVLRYEKRTKEHGQAMASQMETLTPKEEVIDDALAAVALLRSRDDIDPESIYVLGHSLGGTLAPLIGAEDREIAGLIILAGAARPLEDIILEQYHYLAGLEEKVTEETEAALQDMQLRVERVKDPDLSLDTPADKLPLGMPASYWLYLRDYNPAETAKTLSVPVLILQGERDYQVTMEDFTIWQDELSSRTDVAFKSYPGLNHLFMKGEGPGNPNEYMQPGNVAQEVVDDIVSWLQVR